MLTADAGKGLAAASATQADGNWQALFGGSMAGGFYFVELSASLETRLERNETPHRLERKASKRDIKWSKSNLLEDAEIHRLNFNDGEIWFENHLKIDNTDISPDEVADMVIRQFKLAANNKDEKEYRFGF